MAVFQIVYIHFSSILFQLLVTLFLSKQDWEPLSALALVCLCPAGLTPCSC